MAVGDCLFNKNKCFIKVAALVRGASEGTFGHIQILLRKKRFVYNTVQGNFSATPKKVCPAPPPPAHCANNDLNWIPGGPGNAGRGLEGPVWEIRTGVCATGPGS